MYIADEVPVSCPTCGHFVSYSVEKCATCTTDLSEIDLRALAAFQWEEQTKNRSGFLWLFSLVGFCWLGLYAIA